MNEVSVQEASIWCCPGCQGGLDYLDDGLSCQACQRQYTMIDSIPDLRVELDCWIDLEDDRRRAREAAQRVQSQGLEATIQHIFLSSRKMDERQAQYRTRQVMSGVDKCIAQCGDWLKPVVNNQGVLLEIGCGPGQMLAAAAQLGRQVAGVDVSMEWLVIARHMIKQYGGEPLLAAGFAEQLPIRSGVVSSIISLDVLEHVGDQQQYVKEISRTLTDAGNFALSTPNRFSLSPEPHVNVWGVGYLPRKFQATYVHLSSGRPYTFTRLLSVWESRKLFSPERGFDAEIVFPEIPEHEIVNFGALKTSLARIYNRLVGNAVVKLLLPFFGAYYRITGRAVQQA